MIILNYLIFFIRNKSTSQSKLSQHQTKANGSKTPYQPIKQTDDTLTTPGAASTANNASAAAAAAISNNANHLNNNVSVSINLSFGSSDSFNFKFKYSNYYLRFR